jgi:hypothetical protein
MIPPLKTPALFRGYLGNENNEIVFGILQG